MFINYYLSLIVISRFSDWKFNIAEWGELHPSNDPP